LQTPRVSEHGAQVVVNIYIFKIIIQVKTTTRLIITFFLFALNELEKPMLISRK